MFQSSYIDAKGLQYIYVLRRGFFTATSKLLGDTIYTYKLTIYTIDDLIYTMD